MGSSLPSTPIPQYSNTPIEIRGWVMKKVMLFLFLIVFSYSAAFAEEPREQLEPLPIEDIPPEERVLFHPIWEVGDPITIEVRDTDIRDVLRLISAHAGVNIIPAPNVKGNITIALRDVPWATALGIILETHGFAFARRENVIMVAREGELRPEGVKTKTFFLEFADVAVTKESIRHMLSPAGKITANEKAGALIITDTPTHLLMVERVIRELDQEISQVAIEVRILEITRKEGVDIGIEWNIEGGITRGGVTPTTFPFPTDFTLPDFGITKIPPVDPGAFVFGILSADAFRAVFRMLITEADAEVLSSPTITTLSNEKATITTAVRHPIPTMAFVEATGMWEITGYKFLDSGVILNVTPVVRRGRNEVVMHLKPQVSEVTEIITFPGGLSVPVLRTKETDVRLTVRDGETLAIGGLIQTKEAEKISRVPVLGYIPIIRHFFTRMERPEKLNVVTELIIFVTPRIL
jgi:type IV pilus assembly protein PilQ